jgi:BON domain
MANETEHAGGGQSGYGAGRDGDRAMGTSSVNQTDPARETDKDGAAVRTDERFQGRGGETFGGTEGSTGNPGQPLPQPPATGAHEATASVGYTRSDDRIREAVSEALAGDNHVDAAHIEVIVKNGEVLLTGVVDDLQQKRMAGDLSLNQAGVQDVQNQLRIEGNPKRDDAV